MNRIGGGRNWVMSAAMVWLLMHACPSPGFAREHDGEGESASFASGKIRWIGSPADFPLVAFVRRSDGGEYVTFSLDQAKTEFRIGPLASGVYELKFYQSGIEVMNDRNDGGLQSLRRVEFPCDDLEIVLRKRKLPSLRGRVIDAVTGQPVQRFRVRVTTSTTPRESDWDALMSWKEVQNFDGRFEIPLMPHESCCVVAMSDEHAPERSALLEPEQASGELLELKLTPGVPFLGTVVGMKGDAIDGAEVRALSMAGSGAVRTIGGQFLFTNLPRGPGVLRITHPERSTTDVAINATVNQVKPLQIVLDDGVTLRGQVFNSRGRPQSRVEITVRAAERVDYESRIHGNRQSVSTDGQGRYQIEHLPEGLFTLAGRTNAWRTWGVIHRTIQLRGGNVCELDLGGTGHVRGRIKLNGKPLAKKRLQLTGEDATSRLGIMKMFTSTDEDGRFVLHGPPPGLWTLYYDTEYRRRWNPVRKINVPFNGDLDLGEIEQITGRVEVQCEPRDSDCELRLVRYSRVPLVPRDQGRLMDGNTKTASPAFVDVTPGEYELMASGTASGAVVRRVSVTKDHLDQVVRLEIPVSSSRISGRWDSELQQRNRVLWFEKEGGGLRGYFRADKQGHYELPRLPPGRYTIYQAGRLIRERSVAFELLDGESRELDLNADQFTASVDRATCLVAIRVFDSSGALTPMPMHLTNGIKLIEPFHSFRGKAYFDLPPGSYTAVIGIAGQSPFQQDVWVPDDPTGETPEPATIDVWLPGQ